jgi:Icc-related predicted phosphoesterase
VQPTTDRTYSGLGLRILAFSDLHTDLDAAARLVEASRDADVVVAAGDLASVHDGLEETVEALAAIVLPTILIPGNHETDTALREACTGWDAATELHGETAEVDGVTFFGLGAGVPVTPWDWSFDLTEEEAAAMLSGCPEGAMLIVHSPPKGYVDSSGGTHLGSEAVLRSIESARPPLALCGHIHESWGEEATIGPTRVVNLGPQGTLFDLEE